MFSLDNFDIDFDDDFSSSIFSKVVNKGTNESSESCGNSVLKENRVNDVQSKDKNQGGVPCNSFLGSRENLKRPSAQDEKPHKRFSREGLVQRKFPGPAGLLPDRPFKEIRDMELTEKSSDGDNQGEEDDTEKNKPIYSQSSGSVFMESAYQKLVNDFGLNEGNNHLSKYTVEWVKKTAISKGFQGRKIPFLALVLHCVDHTMPDPVLLLRDPTGEIKGSLHREVWADLGGKLQTGIVLALRQVGVLITGVIRRQIYLNITINNILAIYRGSGGEEDGVETTPVNRISRAELLRAAESWKAQGPRPQPSASRPPPSPFSMVNDLDEIRNLRNRLKNFVEGAAGGEGPRRPPGRKEPLPPGRRKTDEVLADLGIDLSDGDFTEEMNIPLDASTPTAPEKAPPAGTSTQVLSQAETLIFQEVLSGINLDEFEM